MSSSSLEYVSRGLTKAFERRHAMQQQTMQQTQLVDKAEDNSDVITTNATTKTLSNEQYQAAIIQTMIARIKQNKETK